MTGGPRRHAFWLTRSAAVLAAAGAALCAAPAGASPDGELAVAFENNGKRTPCAELALKDLEVDGGCQVIVEPAEATFTIVSLFGDRELATCAVGFTIAIGPSGDLALSQVTSSRGASDASGPCGDILACRTRFDVKDSWELKRPWRGQLSPADDGAMDADLDLCVDTCVGRLEGPARLRLERTEGHWRLRAADSVLGNSGLELRGSWLLRPSFGDELTIDTTAAKGS